MATLNESDEHSERGVAPDLVISRNAELSVYEAAIGGHEAAGLLYSDRGGHVVLLATSVHPAFRGRGVAGGLLAGVLELLRAEGRTAMVTCPFAAAYVRRHPEYADVVRGTFPRSTHSATEEH